MKAKKSLEKNLVIKRSSLPSAGKGLFSKQLIKRGTPIVEYKGKVSSWKDADHDDGRNAYIYYVTKDHVIDARENKNLLARYANDAKGFKRKKGIKNNSTYTIDRNKVFIKAMKDIMPGDEILVGYGKEYWDVMKENKRKKS